MQRKCTVQGLHVLVEVISAATLPSGSAHIVRQTSKRTHMGVEDLVIEPDLFRRLLSLFLCRLGRILSSRKRAKAQEAGFDIRSACCVRSQNGQA